MRFARDSRSGRVTSAGWLAVLVFCALVALPGSAFGKYAVDAPETYAPMSVYADIEALNPCTPVIGDIDGDGWNDIVVGMTAGQNANAFFGPDFTRRSSTPPWYAYYDHVITTLGDLNNDGSLDLLTAGTTSFGDMILWTWNDGTGAFTASATGWGGFGWGGDPRHIVSADLDGNGADDMVVHYPNTSTYFQALSGGGFSWSPIATGGNADAAPQLRDFDRDGDIDLAFMTTDSHVIVHLNGGGWFSVGGSVEDSASVGTATNFAAGRFGATTDQGFAFTLPDSNALRVIRPVWSSVIWGGSANKYDGVTLDADAPTLIATGDLNSDGYDEIVTASVSSSTVSVYSNIDGTIQHLWTGDAPASPNDITLGHLDADAWMDVVITSDVDDVIRVYYNAIPPVITKTVEPSAPDGENGWYASVEPTVTLEVNEADASLWKQIGATAPSAYAGPVGMPEGVTDFSYWAVDSVGYSVPTSTVTFRVDLTAPTSPLPASDSHTTDRLSTDRTIRASVTGATDAASGVSGYSWNWSKSRTSNPDTVADGTVAITGVTSPSLSNGAWYFNVRARDLAGHWSTTASIGPFHITSPVVVPDSDSTVVAEAPAGSDETTTTIEGAGTPETTPVAGDADEPDSGDDEADLGDDDGQSRPSGTDSDADDASETGEEFPLFAVVLGTAGGLGLLGLLVALLRRRRK
jgi:hypothetical protein